MIPDEAATTKSGQFFSNQNFENEAMKINDDQGETSMLARTDSIKEERKFTAEMGDIAVQSSSFENLPPIVHPLCAGTQFALTPAFIVDSESQSSKLHDNGVVEELGDSTVDQI